MSARWTSRLTLILAPLAVLACGDDSTGTGGGGGAGGEGVPSSTTGSPTTTVTSTATATSTSTGTSDGGGGSGEGGLGEGGAGGETGTGGGGGVPVIEGGEEACPGDDPPLEVVAGGDAVVITGTTEGAGDDHDTCFASDPDDFVGGDWVYAFTLDATASLVVTLVDGPDTDANLSVRTTCDSNLPADGFCFDHTSNGDVKSQSTEAAAGTYYVIVDSDADAEGDYELTITASLPACGDGILNTGEECDVGPGVENDGCVDPGAEDECTTEQPLTELDACPGEDIDIPEGSTRLLAADGLTTTGFADDYLGSCTGGTLGLDRVFMFTPAVTGVMTVEVGLNDVGTSVCLDDANDLRCWDYVLYAQTSCGDALTEVECSDAGFDAGDNFESISFSVVANLPVFVIVDGYDDMEYSQGSFDLDITLVEGI